VIDEKMANALKESLNEVEYINRIFIYDNKFIIMTHKGVEIERNF
jgi:hypothetical protein